MHLNKLQIYCHLSIAKTSVRYIRTKVYSTIISAVCNRLSLFILAAADKLLKLSLFTVRNNADVRAQRRLHVRLRDIRRRQNRVQSGSNLKFQIRLYNFQLKVNGRPGRAARCLDLLNHWFHSRMKFVWKLDLHVLLFTCVANEVAFDRLRAHSIACFLFDL